MIVFRFARLQAKRGVAASVFALMAFILASCATPALSPQDEAERKMFLLSKSGHSLEEKGQYRDAVRIYEEAMQIKPAPGDLPRSTARRWVQNNLAWLLATCPDSSVRDGPRALRLGEQLVASKPKQAPYLDTLGAAYAETGQFEKAVKTQQQALSLLPTAHPLRNEYILRLSAYRERKAWRKP